MHQSATRKQYLGEQVVPTTTPTTGTKPSSPSMSPITVNKLTIDKQPFVMYSNNTPVNFTISFENKDSVTQKPSPGKYVISVKNSVIPAAIYKFAYDCQTGELKGLNNKPNFENIDFENDYKNVKVFWNGKDYKNMIQNYTSGFEKKSFNQLKNALEGIADLSNPTTFAMFDTSIFGDLKRLCS
jgi:hypothetical protein